MSPDVLSTSKILGSSTYFLNATAQFKRVNSPEYLHPQSCCLQPRLLQTSFSATLGNKNVYSLVFSFPRVFIFPVHCTIYRLRSDDLPLFTNLSDVIAQTNNLTNTPTKNQLEHDPFSPRRYQNMLAAHQTSTVFMLQDARGTIGYPVPENPYE